MAPSAPRSLAVSTNSSAALLAIIDDQRVKIADLEQYQTYFRQLTFWFLLCLSFSCIMIVLLGCMFVRLCHEKDQKNHARQLLRRLVNERISPKRGGGSDFDSIGGGKGAGADAVADVMSASAGAAVVSPLPRPGQGDESQRTAARSGAWVVPSLALAVFPHGSV